MTQEQAILAALGKVIDPELRLPITELGMVGSVAVDGSGSASIEIKLTVVGCPASDRIEADVRAAAAAVAGVTEVKVALGVMSPEEREALQVQLRGSRAHRENPFDAEALTRVFLIGSGKGGVGKSTITANLAVALASLGHKVGLIDADIFGFSIPGQLGLTSKPTKVDDLILPPVYELPDASGNAVKVISIGMFIDGNQPVAWRGPMLHRAVAQFLTDVHWGDLDFLLVDLPPGTGDIAISLGQLLPSAKSIVVTTPQPAAAQVAERSGSVGNQTGQKVFGVIENMSWLVTETGSRVELFGAGGGEAVATRLSEITGEAVEVLGQIPMSVALREGSDEGVPIVVSNQTDAAAAEIMSIAKKIAQSPMGLAGRKLKVNLK